MNQAKSLKGWSYSTGERGCNRVRAYARPGSGMMFLEFYESSQQGRRPNVRRVALGHRDPGLAKAAADRLAAELRQAFGGGIAGRPITLRVLFDNYLREVTPQKGADKQGHDRRCSEMFLRALGGDFEARALSRREWDRFIRERRSGALRPLGATRRPVGDRVVAYDLQWLRAVLNWAAGASDGRGGMLLDRNPVRKLPLPRSENPKRPVISEEQFTALLAAADFISPQFTLALVLARETGHRIGAIRQLRWADIDLKGGLVRWRAESDKIGFEHETPLTADAVEYLVREKQRQDRGPGCAGQEWVFPSPGDPATPCSRHLFRDYWERAAAKAGLPRGERIGYHSLRRSFATDLKSIPLKDLCWLGGWKDPQTILKCYQRADEETMRAALGQRRRLAGAVV